MTFSLIYHDVVTGDERESIGFPGPLAARYKLDPARFAQHLDAVAGTGIEVGLIEPGVPPPAAALTFDDGGSSALATADALEARGFKGHFFVVTGRVGEPGFLSADGVSQLADRGHLVGSHSHSHPTYMGKLTFEQILHEWTKSRGVLEELLGAAPLTASVPGGFLSAAVVSTAQQAGFALLMTSEPVAKPRRRAGLILAGRYTIWDSTPARTAAAYARGRNAARARLWLEWNAKKLPKKVSPRAYQTLRRMRARRG